MKYTLVSGIHGVGKSTLLKRITEVKSIRHYSISDLIRKGGQTILTNEKNTKNIDLNQGIWKNTLKKISQNFNEPIFLDGHFVLLDDKGNLVSLPEKTFEDIQIKNIIVVTASVAKIQERLQVRDSKEWDIDLLSRFQLQEMEKAKKFAEKNQIPIYIYESDNQYNDLLNFINDF
ncbi:ATP-binding protein [Listeria seeligeri]|uniref:ATP-binding protein n=1 Tax=Listeria seeligeri TaxID=1640 RepID=UPI0010E92FE7|nr:ATP-binding protein [Listeria seeligeri]